ncbi:MAG: branched-chain amino acid ABC transporter permease [Dehalococcoidia bacterium]
MRNKSKITKLSSVSGIIILCFCVPLFVTGPYQLHMLIMAGVAIILASSVRLISSSGLLSLAHGGMMAIGAYTSALLVMKLGISSWVSLLAAGVAAGLFALVIGYPFVRLKGLYFALTTVFLNEVINLIISQWKSLTGGTSGIISIPHPDPIVIPGLITIDFSSKVDFYYFILVLTLVILLILYAFEHSRIGQTWRSIGQAPAVAESIGINVPRYQVMGFVIGCFFAGVTGAFYSHYITALTPSSFNMFWSIYIVIYMTVGGMGSFAGPIIGAFLLTLLPETASVLKEYQPYVFAGVLILVTFLLPDGLVSLPGRVKAFIKKRRGHA